MELALDADGLRVDPFPKGRATCPACAGSVIAKCGEIVVPHWAHESRIDCDTWSDGETAWHRQWKSEFPKDWREVVIGAHRADVRTNSGWVIELQHSPISPQEIREREDFYGRMVWVVDCDPFAKNLSLKNEWNCPECGGSVIRSKWEFGGGLVCWRGRGGCGRKFTESDKIDRLWDWKWMRPSWMAARSPIFFDLPGYGLVRVACINSIGMWGRVIEREKFIMRALRTEENGH